MTDTSQLIIEIIKLIPKGKVSTYGRIGKLAGLQRGARQVARILHTCTTKHNLPWQRVVNAKGMISLSKNGGYHIQKELLQKEGVKFINERIPLENYLWEPDNNDLLDIDF